MNKSMVAVCLLSSVALLSGCVIGGGANDEVSYDAYEPGYTGYTVGAGSYSIPNGYGPAFWNPGYYNYTGHDSDNNQGCATYRSGAMPIVRR